MTIGTRINETKKPWLSLNITRASILRKNIMNEKQELTQELLKELLHYDPETGVFTWKERDIKYFRSLASCKTWNSRFANKVAGSRRICGSSGKEYIDIHIIYRLYASHRLAYLYMTGNFPEDQIDHDDGNGTNNVFSNLSPITGPENQKNMRLKENNTSGFNGVTWCKRTGKWQAYVTVNREYKFLGRFLNINDAIGARNSANIKYGFHKNHGQDRPL